MKLKINTLAAAAGALAFSLAPSLAHAEREYFLVGVRHIYAIGSNRDAHLAEREGIEKNYADAVAQDEQTFQRNVDGGANRDQESSALNADLDQIAGDRDSKLGAIFERRDDLRESHPELHVDTDGPYQVMGINYHVHNSSWIFDSFVVYAPWPGYVVVGAPYGGWHYGVVYTPGVFIDLYAGWHRSWGGDRFYGGFYGNSGLVVFHPEYFHDSWGGGFVYRGAGPAFRRGGDFRPGYEHGGGGFSHVTPYPLGNAHNGGGFSHPIQNHPGNGGGFNHSNPGHPANGYGFGPAGVHPATGGVHVAPERVGGGYSHSGGSSYRAPNSGTYRPSGTSGSFNRAPNSGSYKPSGPSGSFNRAPNSGSYHPSNSSRPTGSSSGGYSHSNTSRGSDHGSFGSSRSTGNRSTGSDHSSHSGGGNNHSGGGSNHSDHDDKKGH